MTNTKFASESTVQNSAIVSRKSVLWDVVYELPSEVVDTMPAIESAKINGTYLQAFYTDPAIGHVIEHGSHAWQIGAIVHYPVNKNLRGQRRISRILTNYMGAIGSAVKDDDPPSNLPC